MLHQRQLQKSIIFFPIPLKVKVSKRVNFTFVFHVSVTRLDGFVKFVKFQLN